MKQKKAPAVTSDINVTPMVDVMLVLLIIFMVITPMLTKGVSVDMVKTKNPIAMQDADKEDAVLIAVTRDGKVFLSPGNKQHDGGRAARQGAGSARPTSWTRRSTSRRTCAPGTRRWKMWSTTCARRAWIRLGLLTEQVSADKSKPQRRRSQ